MDKNIKIKLRVLTMCSTHCILEVLIGTAEFGLTPYSQDRAGFEDKFSKLLELGAVLKGGHWVGLGFCRPALE